MTIGNVPLSINWESWLVVVVGCRGWLIICGTIRVLNNYVAEKSHQLHVTKSYVVSIVHGHFMPSVTHVCFQAEFDFYESHPT